MNFDEPKKLTYWYDNSLTNSDSLLTILRVVSRIKDVYNEVQSVQSLAGGEHLKNIVWLIHCLNKKMDSYWVRKHQSKQREMY